MYGPLGKYSIAMKISSKHACIVQTPASLDLHPNILLENSKLYQCVREWGIRFQCSPLTYLQQNLPSSDTVLTCLQGITIYPSGNKYGFLDKVGLGIWIFNHFKNFNLFFSDVPAYDDIFKASLFLCAILMNNLNIGTASLKYDSTSNDTQISLSDLYAVRMPGRKRKPRWKFAFVLDNICDERANTLIRYVAMEA